MRTPQIQTSPAFVSTAWVDRVNELSEYTGIARIDETLSPIDLPTVADTGWRVVSLPLGQTNLLLLPDAAVAIDLLSTDRYGLVAMLYVLTDQGWLAVGRSLHGEMPDGLTWLTSLAEQLLAVAHDDVELYRVVHY